MADKLPAGVSAADEDLPPGVYRPGQTWAQRLVSTVAEPVTKFVAAGVEGLGYTGVPQPERTGLLNPPAPGQAGPAAQSIAEVIVPQTPAQVGMQVGTLGAGGIAARAGMGMLPSAAMRIGGGTAGGAAGGAVGDEGALQGGLTGLGATLFGELLGGGVGLIMRARPGGREAQKLTDLDNFAEQVADYLPSLRGMTGPDIKRATVSANGFQRELGNRYANKLTEVEALIHNQKIRVPALGQMVKETIAEDIGGGMTKAVTREVPKPMTLSQAVDELKKLGHAGFGGGKDLNPSIVGRDQRVDWKEVVTQITDELNRINPTGEATKLFTQARGEWAVGSAVAALFKGDQRALRGVPDGVEVDFNAMRSAFERTFRRFERSLLPDELEEVVRVVYRGGPFGSRDLVGPRSGMLDAPARFYRHGGGTGTAAIVGPRALLPGLGDQYTGQTPYQLPAGAQMGIDAFLQQMGGAGLNPLGVK